MEHWRQPCREKWLWTISRHPEFMIAGKGIVVVMGEEDSVTALDAVHICSIKDTPAPKQATGEYLGAFAELCASDLKLAFAGLMRRSFSP